MAKDIMDFVVAVLEQLHGWISGGILALGVEVLDRVWKFKIPRKPWIAIFIVGGLIVSVFGAWREEHEKVMAQRAYVRVEPNGPWIPPSPPWIPNEYEFVNFGKVNSSALYPAEEEASLQELIIRPAPSPLVMPLSPVATYGLSRTRGVGME